MFYVFINFVVLYLLLLCCIYLFWRALYMTMPEEELQNPNLFLEEESNLTCICIKNGTPC